MIKINEIKVGTYVTPKVGSMYTSHSENIKLVKDGNFVFDDTYSVSLLIEEGNITDFHGNCFDKGSIIYLGLEDIKIIHA